MRSWPTAESREMPHWRIWQTGRHWALLVALGEEGSGHDSGAAGGESKGKLGSRALWCEAVAAWQEPTLQAGRTSPSRAENHPQTYVPSE